MEHYHFGRDLPPVSEMNVLSSVFSSRPIAASFQSLRQQTRVSSGTEWVFIYAEFQTILPFRPSVAVFVPFFGLGFTTTELYGFVNSLCMSVYRPKQEQRYE